MKLLLSIFCLLLLSSCNSSSGGSGGLVSPAAPSAPTSSPEQSPANNSQEAPAQQSEPVQMRQINGTITLLWNALFPSAYAADQIHVYRFKTEREYEYLSSHEVSDSGEFSLSLDPANTNGYMLHLVLEEETFKKGMREKIISGDYDQSITLDSFETIKSQIDLKWFSEQNILRNEVLADAASEPSMLKGVSAEELMELASVVDDNFALTKNWDDLTKPDAFEAFKKVLAEDLTDEIVWLGKGEITSADFFNRIKKIKVNTSTTRFDGCAQRPLDQTIVTDGKTKPNEKFELWFVPLNSNAKKFLSEDSKIGFERKDDILGLMKSLDQEMGKLSLQTNGSIHYRLVLIDKNSKSRDTCDFMI